MKLLEVNNLPIRYKLIALLLLISILPSIALGFVTSWTADRVIGRQVNENTLQLIGQVNKTLESYANNMQNISYFISFNSEVKEFLDEGAADEHYELLQFLRGLTTLYPEVAGVLVVNHDGEYISNELYTRSTALLTEEPWYQEAVENRGILKIISHPIKRNLASHANYAENEVVSIVRAILDPETQQVRGVVLIDLKLQVIAEATKDTRLGKSGYLMVTDENGESIYSPAEQFIRRIPNSWMQGESGSFSKNIEGERVQFLYQKSPFTNWTTVGVFSTKESAYEVREIRFYVISFLFFVCLVGIAASYYLSYSMSRPIGQLMAVMQRVEEGNMSIRYEGKRRDEIGMLGRSFNNMLEQIHKLLVLTELQERQKREAELRSLQAHIKPHFLYNTLDTINWMARKRGAVDVAEVVESLSRLFRIGLSKGNDIIPFVEEMEHIHSYLRIQKARYQDKLNYVMHVDPDIQDVLVLKLVLQPIVENAIYHGIKARRGPGHIVIQAEEQEEHLVISVSDDGSGILPEQLQLLRKRLESAKQTVEMKDMGYGMMNVQARIKLTFGDAYGMHIDSVPGEGTTVTCILPLMKEL